MDKLLDYGRQFTVVKQEQLAELDMKHVVATNVHSFLALNKVEKSQGGPVQAPIIDREKRDEVDIKVGERF